MNDEIEKQCRELAEEILTYSASSILLKLRFMQSAMGRLFMTPEHTDTIATDGRHFLYDPFFIIKSADKYENAVLVIRQYLHVLMHCIYRHMFFAENMNKRLWNLACDIAVENVILGIDNKELALDKNNMVNDDRVDMSIFAFDNAKMDFIKNSQAPDGKYDPKKIRYMTADYIYIFLVNNGYGEYYNSNVIEKKLRQLENLFKMDDHKYWYEKIVKESKNVYTDTYDTNTEENDDNVYTVSVDYDIRSDEEVSEDWRNVSNIFSDSYSSYCNGIGKDPGSALINVQEVNRENVDYSDFLRRFSTKVEGLKINEDEFDYIYYSYGNRILENTPLIEPLEYGSVEKIKDFVIAIDTSGSCMGSIVQKFIQKTYNILMQSNMFDTQVNVHLIQADATIQTDEKLTSKTDFETLLDHLKIHGAGGTDFRPVVKYIDNLIEMREFTNLKGVIYFSDGWGPFPTKAPDYEVAFVYLDGMFYNNQIPSWVTQVLLKQEDVDIL